MPRRSACALAAVLCAAAPSAAQDHPPEVRCDPEVRVTLEEAAQDGAEEDVAVIREVVRDAESIFDLSCLDFNFRHHDILFDPSAGIEAILREIRRELCRAARAAYGRYVTRPVADVRREARGRLPGLDLPPAPRGEPPVLRTPDENPRSDGDRSRYRDAIGGPR